MFFSFSIKLFLNGLLIITLKASVSIFQRSKHFSFYFSFICNPNKKKVQFIPFFSFLLPFLLGTKHAWEKHFLFLISTCNLDARFLKFTLNIKTYKKFEGLISKLVLRETLLKNNWYSIFYIFVNMNNTRDTNYFTKKIYKLLMWWVIIGKWKRDINGGLNEN